MIGEVRSARLLTGLRGAPAADRAALVDAIVRVGQLAADHPESPNWTSTRCWRCPRDGE